MCLKGPLASGNTLKDTDLPSREKRRPGSQRNKWHESPPGTSGRAQGSRKRGGDVALCCILLGPFPAHRCSRGWACEWCGLASSAAEPVSPGFLDPRDEPKSSPVGNTGGSERSARPSASLSVLTAAASQSAPHFPHTRDVGVTAGLQPQGRYPPSAPLWVPSSGDSRTIKVSLFPLLPNSGTLAKPRGLWNAGAWKHLSPS